MNFTTSELNWGPQRYHGWRMNVQGMHRAAMLRRRTENRVGGGIASNGYAVSVRIRPDGKEKGGFASLDASDLPPLWACIASRATAGALNGTLDRDHRGAGLQRARDHNRELVACNPLARSGLDELGNDNCFLGTTAAVDALLEALHTNAAEVYVEAKRHNYHMLSRPETQLTTAAKLVGLKLLRPVWYESLQNSASPRSSRGASALHHGRHSCHIDDLQILAASRTRGG